MVIRNATAENHKENNSEIKRYRSMPSDLFYNLYINVKVKVQRKAVQHIWQRHGCYENAQVEQKLRRNRGKRPSHFRNQKILEKAIASTVNRPNWTRSGNIGKDGRFRFKKAAYNVGGIRRFRSKKNRRNKKNKRSKKSERILHFKLFTKTIGFSGQGYGGEDEVGCSCCCSVVDPIYGLVTSYPILTKDAKKKGSGEITPCHKGRSSMTTSSYSSDENKNSLDYQSLQLMTAKSLESEKTKQEIDDSKEQT